MRILLDTHILLWALSDDPKLSAKARKLIENAAEIYVSAATFWELAIKVGAQEAQRQPGRNSRIVPGKRLRGTAHNLGARHRGQGP